MQFETIQKMQSSGITATRAARLTEAFLNKPYVDLLERIECEIVQAAEVGACTLNVTTTEPFEIVQRVVATLKYRGFVCEATSPNDLVITW